MLKQTIAVAGVALGLSLMVGACGGMEYENENSIPCLHEVVVNPDVALDVNKSLENNVQDRIVAGPDPVVDTDKSLDNRTAEVELADPVVDTEKSLDNRTAEVELATDPSVDTDKSLEDNRQDWVPTTPDPSVDTDEELDNQADPKDVELARDRIDPRDRPGLDD